MSVDLISQILQGLGYVSLLVVLAYLGMNAARQPELRRFWILLALAWTMNLLGNIAWVVNDLVTGVQLDSFSSVDIFYVSRYLLIGSALWFYPIALPRRAWLWIGTAMLMVNAIAWMVYYPPIMTLQKGPWTDFLGYAMYPILDVALITLAWLRYRASRQSPWARVALLLFCSMASYGLANTLNLSEYAFSAFTGGVLQNLFWILTDVFVLVMALGAQKGVFEPVLTG